MGQPSEGTGSWSTEAAKLFAALIDTTDVAGEHGGEHGDEPDGRAAAQAPDPAARGTDCGFCPLCRAKRVLDRPEVREPLMAAASSLLQAVSAVLSTPVPDSPDSPDSPQAREEDQDR